MICIDAQRILSATLQQCCNDDRQADTFLFETFTLKACLAAMWYRFINSASPVGKEQCVSACRSTPAPGCSVLLVHWAAQLLHGHASSGAPSTCRSQQLLCPHSGCSTVMHTPWQGARPAGKA